MFLHQITSKLLRQEHTIKKIGLQKQDTDRDAKRRILKVNILVALQ